MNPPPKKLPLGALTSVVATTLGLAVVVWIGAPVWSKASRHLIHQYPEPGGSLITLQQVRIVLGLAIALVAAGRALCVPRGEGAPNALVAPVLLVFVGILIADGGWAPAVGTTAITIAIAWIAWRRDPTSPEKG